MAKSEIERREEAQAHKGEVIEGSGVVLRPTTERITEALASTYTYVGNGAATVDAEGLRVIRQAARDHLTCLQDWITCPTCGGSGWLGEITDRFCPDCVGGLVPTPEHAERVARALAVAYVTEGNARGYSIIARSWDEMGADEQSWWIAQANAGLLASRQGDTDE